MLTHRRHRYLTRWPRRLAFALAIGATISGRMVRLASLAARQISARAC